MRAPRHAVTFLLLCVAAFEPRPVEAAEPRLVAVVPFGKVDQTTLKQVATALESGLQVKARIDAERPLPKEAYYAPRKRWRAEKLLDAIDAAPPEGAWKVVIVTDAEISTTKGDIFDWGIGGLGTMGGRSCVVSTHIIKKRSKTKKQTAERLAKLAVHELGHTLGLEHCEVFACVMADAKGKLIRSLDVSTHQYCGRCKKQLPEALLTPP